MAEDVSLGLMEQRGAPLAAAFETALHGLRGLTCVRARSGYGTGTRIALDFAPTVDAAVDDRVFLFIMCSWRLRSNNGVVTSAWSADFDEVTGFGRSMLEGNEMLEGAVVGEAVLLSTDTFDLRIDLDGGLTFEVFCDIVLIEDDDNYTLQHGNTLWCVGERSILSLRRFD